MSKINSKAYKAAKGEPVTLEDLKAEQRRNLMQKPVGSDIGSQTVAAYEEGGFLPALATGLANLAGSSAGSKIIAGVSGGDRFSKTAWLGEAQQQSQQEAAQRAADISKENMRQQALESYIPRAEETERKEKEFEQKQITEKEKQDPNSEISQISRKLYAKYMKITPEEVPEMSAADVEKLMPIAEKTWQAELAAEEKAATKKEAAQVKSDTHQDKLEKEYRDMLNLTRARSGGLGLQDAKVNQAIDLRAMLDANYDEKTGKYNVPPALHAELALGLARLLSPTGTVGVEMMEHLRQKTLREGLAGGLIYLGFNPQEVGGSTQDVIDLFAHSIDRQGEVAEDLRDTYIKQFQKRAPTGLSKERRDYVDASEFGSSYRAQKAKSPALQSKGSVQYSQDVLDYAKQYGIAPEKAYAIKQKRTGGR